MRRLPKKWKARAIERIIKLRDYGLTWETIGQRLDIKAGTCSKWYHQNKKGGKNE